MRTSAPSVHRPRCSPSRAVHGSAARPRPSKPLRWNSQSRRSPAASRWRRRSSRGSLCWRSGKAIALRGWAVRRRPWDSSSTEVISSVRRSRKRCSSRTRFASQPRAPRRTRYGGDIQRAGAHLSLLTAAMQDRGQPKLATRHECTDPVRSPSLCAVKLSMSSPLAAKSTSM